MISYAPAAMKTKGGSFLPITEHSELIDALLKKTRINKTGHS